MGIGSLNMKKLIFNKIALAMFFVVFVSNNNAFAGQLSAVSKNIIMGNEPIIYIDSDDNRRDHRLILRVTKDEAGDQQIGLGKVIKTGNFIQIKYKLQDIDGDKDNTTNSLILPTLKVFIKGPELDSNSDTIFTWREVTPQNTPTSKINSDGTAQITIKIDQQFVGATRIGFKLLERTEFGAPYVNSWINVTDILSLTDPYVKTALTNLANWNNPDKVGPTITELRNEADKVSSAHEFGPGDTNRYNGLYPVEDDDLVKVGIFKYGSQAASSVMDLTVNYASTLGTPPIPKYGDKFGVVVWIENQNTKNELPDANELVLTSLYQFNWSLDGTYEGVQAASTVLTEAQGVSKDSLFIILGSATGKDHNSIYTTPQNGYKAGAQGYNLRVDAVPKW